MAENLTLESPQFDTIRQESGIATRDAVLLLWTALNFEMSQRRRTVRSSVERLSPKVVSDAPTTNQNNYQLDSASILLFTGSTNFDLTGFVAPSTDESYVLFLHNTGTATITVKHNSGSSDAENRIRTNSGADISVTQDKSLILLYLNSLWRELKLA